jgi:hypothetical protein
MVYKIGLVGTHNTGKTILSGLVESELRRRKVRSKKVEEGSEKAAVRGLPINQVTTRGAQLWILLNQMREEIYFTERIEKRENPDVIISDRGPDNYCYLENKFGEDAFALPMVLQYMKEYPYDRLYLLPIVKDPFMENGDEITANEVRATEKPFQLEMDKRIRDFLIKHKFPFTELPTPYEYDNWRNIWPQKIVNDTLKVFNKPEKFYM